MRSNDEYVQVQRSYILYAAAEQLIKSVLVPALLSDDGTIR